MSSVAFAVVCLAVAGAVASWIAGAYFFVRTLSTLGSAGEAFYTAAFWMFARKKLQGAAAEDAAKVNKAIVAFMVCILVAVVAISVGTNLQRFAK
jgi:hypothetical protein